MIYQQSALEDDDTDDILDNVILESYIELELIFLLSDVEAGVESSEVCDETVLGLFEDA